MPKWEYKLTEIADHVKLLDLLNADGQEGWELVDIEHEHRGYAIAFLKRMVE